MNILILGGTQYMGIHLVNELLKCGHNVTIATRGKASDSFGDKIKRLIIDRQDPASLEGTFKDKFYDVTIDNIAYSSNDIRYLLDVLQTGKYIITSTVSVYSNHLHENMREEEVDTKSHPLRWLDYEDLTYDEAKRQAEAALFQAYPNQQSAAVRIPFVFGKDDYTERLFFYADHILNEKPMNIDNLKSQLSFINSQEAGRFLAHVATTPATGVINASSSGTISLEEIITYIEENTGKKAIISEDGTEGPLNQAPDFSLDTTLAKKSGFQFQKIDDWVYPLLDHWIETLSNYLIINGE